MRRVFKWILVFLVVVSVTWKVNDVASKRPSLPDPTQLTAKGTCVGFSYHRIKRPHFWNKTIETVTGSDDLKRYNVYADEFAEQIRWMKQQDAHFATLADVTGYVNGEPIPDRCVWVSFDDVDHTVYENAFPVLKQEGIPFTLFVITGHVGESFQNLQLASWDELREMKESGLADFGSHTHDFHYIQEGLATFRDPNNHEAFAKDLQMSRDTLQAELGVTTTAIAYPFGETDDAVTALIERAGYSEAFILSPNPITNENSPFFINRYLLDSHVFEGFVKPYLAR